MAIRAKAREFAAREIEPIAREIDERGEFPREIVPKLGATGFLSGPIGPEYGGVCHDYLSTALIYEEIGRACSSIRGFMAVQLGLVSMCIYDWGSEEQKKKYLPLLISGRWIGCYALTELAAGSDVANMETTASREADRFRLNGKKVWITNGNLADLAIVFATVDKSLRHKGITAFLVEKGAAGFKASKLKGECLGHRAMDHAELELKDCVVGEDALLGAVGDGFAVAMSALDHGRLGVAAGAVGVAQACLDACVKFANEREQFGQKIANFQLVQKEIADMAVETEAARLLTYRAAHQKDRGLKNTLETSMAKLYASEVASRAASRAVSLLASYGYSNEYPVERYYRDIKGAEIYEGTSNIQRIIIAREVLGLKRKGK